MPGCCRVRRSWSGGTIWWFVVALLAGIAAIAAPIMIGRQFGLLAWPLIGAAVVLGFLAWRFYESDGAEQSLLRAAAAAILIAIAMFSLILPSLGQLFPSVALARVLRDSGCAQPVAAAAGYQEPSLVFLAGTSTRLTDGAGAAEFLRGGECRFAFVEARQERSFAQRAEAIGLRYTRGPRIEGDQFQHRIAGHDCGLSLGRLRHERHRRAQACGGATRAAVAAMDRAPMWRNGSGCSAGRRAPERPRPRPGALRCASPSAPPLRRGSSPGRWLRSTPGRSSGRSACRFG